MLETAHEIDNAGAVINPRKMSQILKDRNEQTPDLIVY